MARQQPEARLTNKIKAAIQEAYPGSWAVKVHGGPYQTAGIPDLLVCINGRLVGFEVKTPGREGTLTPRQEATLKTLRRAGAVAAMVTSDTQALDILEEEIT
jgi:hypothetical protein